MTVQEAINILMMIQDKDLPLIIIDSDNGCSYAATFYNTVKEFSEDDGSLAIDYGIGSQYIPIYLR